jgi:hypothetical protein
MIIIEFNVHGSVHRYNILIYIQQDAALHSLFYLETALHISVGTSTYHQERIQTLSQGKKNLSPVKINLSQNTVYILPNVWKA